MRFLVFMIPKVYQPKNGRQTSADFVPDSEMMAKMVKFNDELKKADALLAVDGLLPLTVGARLKFAEEEDVVVTDGPLINAQEVIGGYWQIQAESKREVIGWMKRCPAQDGDVIEIRQIAEMSDFPAELQARAS